MEVKEHHIVYAKLLFKKAVSDLKSAKLLHENNFYSNAVFLAQQSVEKAVKALLALKGIQIREHIVSGYFASEILAFAPEEWESKLREVLRALISLEEHVLKPRYPIVTPRRIWDPEEGYTKELSTEALENAEKILDVVKRYALEMFNVKL